MHAARNESMLLTSASPRDIANFEAVTNKSKVYFSRIRHIKRTFLRSVGLSSTKTICMSSMGRSHSDDSFRAWAAC
jgi:hypothetical protein